MWRVASVAALLALAAIGLSATGAFSTATSAAASGVIGRALLTGFGVLGGLSALLYIAGLVLMLRRYRRRNLEDDREPARIPTPWWLRLLAVAFALALLGTPVALLIAFAHRRKHPALRISLLGPSPRPALTPGRTVVPASQVLWWLLGGMVLAVLIVAGLVIAWRLRRRKLSREPWPRRTEVAELADAAAAGEDALLDGADPRAAIIACYAAMEHGLAVLGAVPLTADTPGEVLDRAAEHGLIRSAAAQTLTGLFRLARYSSHPVTATERDTALDALRTIRADLAEVASDEQTLAGSTR